MKYLIVGLGNIGAEYADTRHNIGFRVLDALAEASNVSFTAGRYGSTATLRYRGRTVILLKQLDTDIPASGLEGGDAG